MTNKAIQNFWMSVWTGVPQEPTGELVDKKMLNESIYSEIIFESLPELILQTCNNVLLDGWDGWSWIGYMSAAMSALSIANGLYRVLYFKFYLKINLVDIDVDLHFISGGDKSIKEHKALKVDLPTRKSIISDLKKLTEDMEAVDGEGGAPMLQKDQLIAKFKRLERDLQNMTDHGDAKKEQEEGTAIENVNDKVDNVISWLSFLE